MPNSKPKLKSKKRAQLREWAFSTMFLVGALICFGVFARNSFLGGTSGNSNHEGAIATLLTGRVEQKRYGSSTFVTLAAAETARLFNRDALWVGPGSSAGLEFDDGTRLAIKENTFLVLRRGMARLGEDSGVQLLKGQVAVKGGARIFGRARFKVEMRDRTVVSEGNAPSEDGTEQIRTDANGNSMNPGNLEPSAAPPPPVNGERPKPPVAPTSPPAKPQDSGSSPMPVAPDTRPRPPQAPHAPHSPIPEGLEAKFYPKPGTLLLLIKEKVARVSFAWPLGVDGKLVVTDDQGTAVASLPVTAKSRYLKQSLPMGKTYRWHLENNQGQIVGPGPFDLTVLPFDSATMNQVLKSDPKRTVEVVE